MNSGSSPQDRAGCWIRSISSPHARTASIAKSSAQPRSRELDGTRRAARRTSSATCRRRRSRRPHRARALRTASRPFASDASVESATSTMISPPGGSCRTRNGNGSCRALGLHALVDREIEQLDELDRGRRARSRQHAAQRDQQHLADDARRPAAGRSARTSSSITPRIMPSIAAATSSGWHLRTSPISMPGLERAAQQVAHLAEELIEPLGGLDIGRVTGRQQQHRERAIARRCTRASRRPARGAGPAAAARSDRRPRCDACARADPPSPGRGSSRTPPTCSRSRGRTCRARSAARSMIAWIDAP